MKLVLTILALSLIFPIRSEIVDNQSFDQEIGTIGENKGTGSMQSSAKYTRYGTPFEAKQLVIKAVNYMKDHDLENSFAKFQDRSSQFFLKDLYVFVFDMDGNMLSHGADADLIGRNLIDLKDSKGQYFVKNFIELMQKKDNGWIEYYWRNYETQVIEQKLTYLHKFSDNIFVGCGAYHSN